MAHELPTVAKAEELVRAIAVVGDAESAADHGFSRAGGIEGKPKTRSRLQTLAIRLVAILRVLDAIRQASRTWHDQADVIRWQRVSDGRRSRSIVRVHGAPLASCQHWSVQPRSLVSLEG